MLQIIFQHQLVLLKYKHNLWYEYLKILSEGKSPYFDKKENKWVEWDEDFKNKQSNAEYNEVIDENDVPF